MIPWLFHPRQCAQAGDNPVDDESTIAEDFTGSLDKPHAFWPESAPTRTVSRSLVQSSTEIAMLSTQAELRKRTSSTLSPGPMTMTNKISQGNTEQGLQPHSALRQARTRLPRTGVGSSTAHRATLVASQIDQAGGQ